jgi:hypothetical protein
MFAPAGNRNGEVEECPAMMLPGWQKARTLYGQPVKLPPSVNTSQTATATGKHSLPLWTDFFREPEPVVTRHLLHASTDPARLAREFPNTRNTNY